MKWQNFERAFFVSVTLFFISFNLFAERNSIILTMKDGRVNAVALLDEPKLTFPQDSLQIETEDFNLIVSRQDFLFYSFGDFELTLIKEKSVDNSFVYLDPPYLITQAGYNHYWSKQHENKLYEYIIDLDNDNISGMSVVC